MYKIETYEAKDGPRFRIVASELPTVKTCGLPRSLTI